MPTLPAPSYPVTAITPGSSGGGGGTTTTHTIVATGGIDGNADTDGTAQALAERLELSDGDAFLFIQGNGSTTGSGRYIMDGDTAVAQSAPTNGSTVTVLNFYLDGATESSGLAEARRVSGQWTVTQGYDFESPSLRKVTPRILEVSGNSVVAEITRDSSGALSHNTLAILPYDNEAEGSVGNRIKLPAPANTGQRIVAFAADGTYTGYPGETVWWEEYETIAATYSYLDVTSMFAESYPLAVDTSVTVAFSGGPSIVVTQNETFASAVDWITDFATKLSVGGLPAGWTVNQAPWNESAVAIYRETIGAGQNISVTAATNGDPLGALSWPVNDGTDETVSDTVVPRGVAGGGEGLLGAPGNEDSSLGGTHTAPGSLNAYRKGWVIVDGDGEWSVEKWPDRINLNHGGWTSNVGPFGSQGDVTHMTAVVEYLKAWMNPTVGEDHLIVADTDQVVGDIYQHRWLVATTNVANTHVTYTLAPPSDAKKYTLSFSRLMSDNGDYNFTVTDGATFSVTLAPGEFCTVQCTHVGYSNSGLASGTGTGELDDPDNQLWGWVQRG